MSSNNAMTTLGYLRAAREWASPVLKKSAFMEKGVLTPEEFVLAGDELVFRCPTWSWEGGDPKWAKPYLPKDKQYLITRRIPCQKRVAEMENMTTDAADDDDDNDWLLSHLIQDSNKATATLEDEFDILDEEGEVVAKQAPAERQDSAEADNAQDEYADMADFEDDNVLQDDVAATTATTNTTSSSNSTHNEEESNLLKVRTYDISISYDKYYQTPRVWMLGYNDADGQPLTGKQMLEDVISDYANRTVTIEAHPHVAGPHASIHPCKHGMVMKAIVRNLIKANSQGDGDEGPSIEMYLFIFLKFVSSIIPTINYDFTMEVRADTRK